MGVRIMTRWAVITLRDQQKNGETVNTLWARGESEARLLSFAQYLIDSTTAEGFARYLVIDLDTMVSYSLAGLARDVWGLHKRSFDERMRG